MKTTNDTEHIRTWSGDFGREYTDRNTQTPAELDEFYRRTFGITRTELNQKFLSQVPRDARILEVGCNIGTQLLVLQQMGFHSLFGIDIQSYALERAKKRISGAVLVQASVLAIPYPDRYFDLVFTSGVLIHIAPADLLAAMDEIHRSAKKWIWGFEYYAPEMTEVAYRGHEALLWKTDYARIYFERFHELELVHEQRIPYFDNDNIDTAFLLHRKA